LDVAIVAHHPADGDAALVDLKRRLAPPRCVPLGTPGARPRSGRTGTLFFDGLLPEICRATDAERSDRDQPDAAARPTGIGPTQRRDREGF